MGLNGKMVTVIINIVPEKNHSRVSEMAHDIKSLDGQTRLMA